jgi:three-Cys-motif partner protein
MVLGPNVEGEWMARDELPTVWGADAHTLAKHEILRHYLNAWFPILTRQSSAVGGSHREVLYVDGFAGPGEYSGGEPGSPLLALAAARDHSVGFPVPVRFIFIEARTDRHENLCRRLKVEESTLRDLRQIRMVPPIHGDCERELNRILDEREMAGIHFGPALVFLDQFGYSQVSISLVKRVLALPQCEVFELIEYREINRFITDESKNVAIDRAFGGNEWRDCAELSGPKREECLRTTYTRALRDRAGAKYVVSFRMHNSVGQPIYWLFFCTSHLRGVEEMKRAMWKLDGAGTFKFSDRVGLGQPAFLGGYDEKWLADELNRTLSGRVLDQTELKEFVLTSTPCYLFKGSLKILEKRGQLSVENTPSSRRPDTFPELAGIRLRFRRRSG